MNKNNNLTFTGKKIQKVLVSIDKWTFELIEKIVVVSTLLSLSLLVFTLIVIRYTLGISPEWSDELPRYLMVWLTFVGMSYCVRLGDHVAIDFLIQKLKGKFLKVFSLAILIVCFIFSLVLLNYGYLLFTQILNSGQTSISLGISMSYVYVSIPVGAFLMSKNFLHLIILNIFSGKVVFSLKEGETE